MTNVTAINDREWRAGLTRTPKGVVKATAGNALLFLRHRFDLAGAFGFDELHQRSSVLARKPWDERAREYPGPVTDDDSWHVAAWLEQRENVAIAPNVIASAIDTVARDKPYNPVVEWIDHVDWDGVPRIGTWAHDILGTEDTRYTRAVGRAWIISSLARAYYPGCQADSMIVLEGGQGVGKSTVLGVLARPWFRDDHLDLAGDAKRAQELLRGVWIYEVAELSGMGRADSSRIKAFISQRDDSYRPSYGRQVVTIPRRCVFAGSTNPDGTGYLKDTTGARRFWPLACGRGVDLDKAHRERDQLFAEALSALRGGEAWHLTDPGLVVAAEAEQADRQEADPWVDELRDWASGRTYATTRDALDQIPVRAQDRTRAHEMRVAAVLRTLGFVCVHGRGGSGGGKKRYSLPCVACGREGSDQVVSSQVGDSE